MPSRGLGVTQRPVKYPALRDAVETEMERRGWEIRDLVANSGIAPNTLRELGTRDPQPRVVRKLSVLGLTPDQVESLKAGRWLSRDSAYDEETWRIAALCSELRPWQRSVVLDLARSLRRNQPDQSF